MVGMGEVLKRVMAMQLGTERRSKSEMKRGLVLRWKDFLGDADSKVLAGKLQQNLRTTIHRD
jgi:hypothetical protein